MDRKKRLFNRVLLVSGASAFLLFGGYLFFTHRSPHHFFIPKGFNGWVTIKFEKPNTPPIPEKDGALEFHIPQNGILETSSKLITGWSRDEYYWENSNEIIPKQVDCGNESCRWIHDFEEKTMGYHAIILSLPDQADTLLWDGTRISKKAESVEVRTGRKTMIHFWVSAQAEPFFYKHDTLPMERTHW
jgi:hypothetical protein